MTFIFCIRNIQVMRDREREREKEERNKTGE